MIESEKPYTFCDDLADNIKQQYIRVKKKKKASLMIIDGSIGEGKTTLAVQIADYINFLDGKPPINLENGEQLGLGGVDFLKKLNGCFNNDLPVCIYDEAGDFSKRGALTKFNAMINRTFETFRAFKVVVIVVLPSFNVLDKDIFDKGIPRMLINCYGRDLKGHYRVYSYTNMMYLKNFMSKSIIPKLCYKTHFNNFENSFYDLTEERSKALDKLSTDNKLSLLAKQIELNESQEKNIFNVKKFDYDVS